MIEELEAGDKVVTSGGKVFGVKHNAGQMCMQSDYGLPEYHPVHGGSTIMNFSYLMGDTCIVKNAFVI